MNNNRTQSMLQRLPVILAVTANSFGLAPGAPRTRRGHGGGQTAATGRRSSAARGRVDTPR